VPIDGEARDGRVAAHVSAGSAEGESNAASCGDALMAVYAASVALE